MAGLRILACSVALAFATAGCDLDEDEKKSIRKLSKDDATAAWIIALLEFGIAALDAGLNVTDDTLTNYEYVCSDGGSIILNGSQNGDVDIEADFDACKIGEITTNGTMRMMHASGSDTTNYSGELTYTGDLKGTCEFDVESTLETSTGKFCRYDIEDLDLDADAEE